MQSRPDVARFLYWDARNEDEVRTALEKKIGGTAVRSEGDALFLAVVLKSTGELVGDIVLHWVSREQGTARSGSSSTLPIGVTGTPPDRSACSCDWRSRIFSCTASSAVPRLGTPPSRSSHPRTERRYSKAPGG